MRRSTVLSLPPHLVFPAYTIAFEQLRRWRRKKFYDVDTKHSASGSMNVSGSIIVVKIPTAPTQAKTAYIAGRLVAP
jgi:hypothetical protein